MQRRFIPIRFSNRRSSCCTSASQSRDVLYPTNSRASRERNRARRRSSHARFTRPDTPPEVHLLSNGRYHVMVTNTGGGYSRWNETAVTRWREDATRDCWGTFFYLRDVDSAAFWSPTHQPTLEAKTGYEAIFSQGRAEFRSRLHEIDTHIEIAVSPENDVEVRRITMTNHAERSEIEVTSYAEIVLAPPAADSRIPPSAIFSFRPTFPSKMPSCALAGPAPHEVSPWIFHLMAVRGNGEVSYETDRAQFIGRAGPPPIPRRCTVPRRSRAMPGSVLDPIVAIRYRLAHDPEEAARVNFVTRVGETREACLALAEKYQDRSLADRVFDLARTHGQVALRQLNTTEAEAQLYWCLASSIIYTNVPCGPTRASDQESPG